MGSRGRVVPPGEGSRQTFMPGELFTWKISGAESDGAIDFGELTMTPDVGAPEHIHHANDEAYYILDGTYRFKIADTISEAAAGAFVFIPRGVPHAWTNIGDQPGHVTVMFTPGGMTGYFRELEPLLPELMAAMPDLSKVDPDLLAKAEDIMRRHGYELVGPPLT
jgi:mannose-6-phosphate isomerase-like protein (cupin superfamily)